MHRLQTAGQCRAVTWLLYFKRIKPHAKIIHFMLNTSLKRHEKSCEDELRILRDPSQYILLGYDSEICKQADKYKTNKLSRDDESLWGCETLGVAENVEHIIYNLVPDHPGQAMESVCYKWSSRTSQFTYQEYTYGRTQIYLGPICHLGCFLKVTSYRGIFCLTESWSKLKRMTL